MPATAWTELLGALPGWQDSIPVLLPPTQLAPGETVSVLIDMVLIPNVTYIAILPGNETWTEMAVASTAHTELTVAATAWTEMT